MTTTYTINTADTERVYYAAVLDGVVDEVRTTRALAESDADWLRQHPARTDRQRFGHGGHIEVRRVQVSEWTGEWIVIEGR